MPCIIFSPIKIDQVSSNGTVNFGDVVQIAPKSTSKSYSGSGGGNTGDFLQTITFVSLTNTLDSDLADNNNAANR